MKVAVIGTGFGENVMARLYRELGFEVDVAHPRDGDAIIRACKPRPDLVSIHSPPFLHREHTLLAIESGCNVLCDKPFGLNVVEASEMRDRAVEAGVIHLLNFEFRHQPSRLKMKELIRAGAIGELRHLNWTYIGSGFSRRPHRWLFEKDKGGGWIGAFGSHAVDTLRWLFDAEILDCGGTMRTETGWRPDSKGNRVQSTAEDAFSAWFTMANGYTVAIDTAYSASVTITQRMILMGSTGALELIDESRIVLHKPDEKPLSFDFPLPAGDPHEPALSPWLGKVRDAIAERRQISPSFEDGVAAATAMDLMRARLTAVDG